MTAIYLGLPFPPSVRRKGGRGSKIELDAADLYARYLRLKSVHRVGKEIGVGGDAVHRRLVEGGYDISRGPEFTDAQRQRIIEYCQNTPDEDFDQTALAAELGKSRQNVCRAAKRLGLTRVGRPFNAHGLEKVRKASQGVWQRRPHPRGMAGKKHSPETLAAMSEFQRRLWATSKAFGVSHMAPDVRDQRSLRMAKIAAARPSTNSYSRTKGGRREDLGDVHFRSSWEANYARYLNLLMRMKVVTSWEFEPKTFWFENIRRGVRSYRPDFLVQYANESKPVYVEVKGWMDPKSKTKIARFRKYYPEEKLEVVAAKEYRSIAAKWSSAIPNWEGK